MLTPTDCKRMDPSLNDMPDDVLQALLDELYLHADFFWDWWKKQGNGVPTVSREDIEAVMRIEIQ